METKPNPVLFVGDNCILENHLTSSSLFFDFGDHPPTIEIQEELSKRWNLHPQLLEALEELHAASLDNDQERMYQARADAREIFALATGSEVAE